MPRVNHSRRMVAVNFAPNMRRAASPAWPGWKISGGGRSSRVDNMRARLPAASSTLRAAIGDQLAARPRHDREDIERERAADRTLDRGAQVGLAELSVLAAADQRKPPMVAAVDGHDGGEGAFRPDEDEAVGRPDVVQLFESGAAEDD